MKHIAIDYGSKQIGLAISDAGGVVAMPLEIIENNAHSTEYIINKLRELQVEVVVIGRSTNLDGSTNSIQSDIDYFTTKLQEHISIPIKPINEVFSSRQAKWGIEHTIRFNPRNKDKRSLHKKQRRIDDKAAAIFLQSYLDSLS